jgi:adenylate cyclase
MDASSLTNIAIALAWPIIVLMAMIIFRQPLRDVLLKILKVKIKAGQFELETVKSPDKFMQGYVSQEVLDSLGSHELVLQPQTVRVTVLAVDIKGFTWLSECMEADSLSKYLHAYLPKMTEIVFDQGGTLNSLRGFFLLASWGAPVSWPNSADRACQAALKMVEAVQQLNDNLIAEALPPLSLRIGIFTGNVFVGNFGTERRFSYSIIGESVDLAIKLSGLCQQYHSDILITQWTLDELKEHYNIHALGELMIKGRSKPITINTILTNMRPSKISES